MKDYNELVEQLLELDEESLELQLGMKLEELDSDPNGTGEAATLDSIDVDVAARAPINPELLATGQKLLKRVSAGLFDLICNPLTSDPESKKVIDDVLDQQYTRAAALLAPMLVSALNLAPAVAVLIATLVVKKLAIAGYKELCKSWKASLPSQDS